MCGKLNKLVRTPELEIISLIQSKPWLNQSLKIDVARVTVRRFVTICASIPFELSVMRAKGYR